MPLDVNSTVLTLQSALNYAAVRSPLAQAPNGLASLGSERKSCLSSILVEHFHCVQRVVVKIPADDR